MKVRFAIGEFPWGMGSDAKLPKLKKLREAFLKLFASYAPKPAATVSGTSGYPAYDMEVPADSAEFENRLKQLHALVKKHNPPSVVVLLWESPDAKEAKRARFLMPYYLCDFVDQEPFRNLLNPGLVACAECKKPSGEKMPQPFLVSKSVLKKYDVFHTSMSLIVVRPKALELLKKSVGSQIEFGEAAIAGTKGKPKGDQRLFWVRPKHQLGQRQWTKTGDWSCPKCRRKIPTSASFIEDAVKKHGRGLYDDRARVEHYGKGKLEIALVPEPGDDWPKIAMSGRLLAELKDNGVKGIAAFTGQLEAIPLFSARSETVLEAETAGSQPPAAKRKEPKEVQKRRDQLRSEMAALKSVPWDYDKDGYVYFQLSTPEIIAIDPMTGEEDSEGPYKVSKFAGPGLYRMPVTAIKEADGEGGGVAVDSASLLIVDNAVLGDLVEVYDWDKATTKSGDYDPKYQQQVADQIGLRFGICSTPPRKFKSQFVGDGCYTIDAKKIEPVKRTR